ncbi:MAG TPA: beta-ketoacyl-[acyl-carrier-protein] synthase family protein [Acetobacteraceae bacterium]|nr:beta-ketoacyl-[acyl-carrier-protein] synthase family protein [Acetobacteraceae bacterium]
MRRVAVTGVGAVSALGVGAESLWENASAGVCGIRPLVNITLDRLNVRYGGQAQAFDAAAHFEPKQIVMMDRAALLGLVAAREAFDQSRPELEDAYAGGVIFGAAIGHDTYDEAYRKFYEDRQDRLHPLTIPRIMPNGATSHISMAFGLRGAAFATASACASSTHAIGLAFHYIRSGQLDLAVTGGTDAPLCVGVLKGWEALRVLSRDVCRPFSRDRAGLAVGEGAGVLVLEEWERARARGADILGEIVGFGMSADAADLTAPDMNGAARAMSQALRDADLAPEAVGYINAHGTGTRLNDQTEVAAIRKVFGAHADRMAVSSTKSMLGHAMCGGGALELIVTLLGLKRGVLTPTIGFHERDPNCDIDCVPNEARAARVEYAISNSFAFGGLNAVLAVRAAPG